MGYVKNECVEHMQFLVYDKHSKINFIGIDILTPFERKATLITCKTCLRSLANTHAYAEFEFFYFRSLS